MFRNILIFFVIFSATFADKLIDDFSRGSLLPVGGQSWSCYSDDDDGGESFVDMGIDSSGFFVSSYALQKGSYEWDPYSNIELKLDYGDGFDVSGFDGIRYRFKGSAHNLVVEMNSVRDWSYHQIEVASSDEWREVKIHFERELTQPDWGKQIAFDGSSLKAISWRVEGKSGDSGKIFLDSIYFVDSIPYIPQNNMRILPPNIPQKVEIPKDKINNPLQEKSSKYLDKGVCLRNWLEEERKFSSFEYDEERIKEFAEMGFKSLKMPIDLDLYVKNREAVLAGTAEFELDSLIYTPLDSMANWSKRYGLSLTVDYHQYDGSLNGESVTDSAYKKLASECWKVVATHFSKDSREDIFFELTNEPGISENVKSSDWRVLAQQMLDSIRVVDSTHTVIFGDSRWYDIDSLVAGDLFDDDNLIYAFHFYEPFVFTHQGASWADMGSSKNVKFPYKQDEWSAEYSHFGIEKSEEWVQESFGNYYGDGNKNSMYNQVAVVKKWAVEKNVAIACNEFGAYGRKADNQSLMNYFDTITSIFRELEIPWQLWYGQFSESGKLRDGAAEALGLK